MTELVNILFLADSNPMTIETANTEIGLQIKKTIRSILLKYFNDNGNYILARNTAEIRNAISNLAETYKSQVPQIQRLRVFLNKLQKNEYFVFLQGHEFTSTFINQIYIGLFALKNNKNPASFIKEVGSYFQPVLKNYISQTFDHSTNIRIGEPVKAKRTCRFCGEMMPKVKFKKKAHTISESFGNKVIICNEECDTCNERFGNSIEEDFSKYFEVFRVMYKIEGKKGVPKIKGKNFEFRLENDEYILDYQKSGKDDEIILESYGTVCLQNVYKCLCKFFISIIDGQNIKHFKSTIQWINSKFFSTQIPKLVIGQNQNLFTSHPKISYYLNRLNNSELPVATCELRTKDLVFLFIVPTFDGIETFKYNEYFKLFRHYDNVKNWKEIDLINWDKLQLKHRISINNNS